MNADSWNCCSHTLKFKFVKNNFWQTDNYKLVQEQGFQTTNPTKILNILSKVKWFDECGKGPKFESRPRSNLRPSAGGYEPNELLPIAIGTPPRDLVAQK